MNNSLHDFIYTSKYAKYNHELKKKETFEETIDRVFNMHITHLSNNYPKCWDSEWFNNMFLETWDACKKGVVYGSQRALQFGGDKILKNNARLYNCAYSYCDRYEFFGEVLWVLLCGCGVGYSVHPYFVNKLNPVTDSKLKQYTHVIEDSIEGWANAIHELMRAYIGENKNKIVPIFDYSQIRPKGSFISGGFIAPGSEGLRNTINNIKEILEQAKGRRLKTIECFSIACHLSDAVLSGGVRRSALSTLFDPNDDDMRNAKTGDWFVKNPHFGRSNNSIMLIRGEDNEQIFNENFESAKEFGEPGFAFINSKLDGYNPCFVGNTVIGVVGQTIKGVTIKELSDKKESFQVYYKNSKGEFDTTNGIAFLSGHKQTIKVNLSNGGQINCTPDHLLQMKNGEYIQAKDSVNKILSRFNCVNINGTECYNYANSPSSFENQLVYGAEDIIVTSIEQGRIEDVYDITVDANEHNFVVLTNKSGNETSGIVVHNCFEIGMKPTLKINGKEQSGWLFCNLTTLSGKDIKDAEDFYDNCEYLSFLGTIQASYTDFSYLGEVTTSLVKDNALLGCSISGVMSNPDILLNKNVLSNGANLVKKTNKKTAEILGIKTAKRTTCIKPE